VPLSMPPPRCTFPPTATLSRQQRIEKHNPGQRNSSAHIYIWYSASAISDLESHRR
jgi:hypothetical protein